MEDKRLSHSVSYNLIPQLEKFYPEEYRNYLRVTPSQFNKLLSIVQCKIEKQVCVRMPIPSKMRLQILLRYLANGNSMMSLAYEFRLSQATVKKIIDETCDAIWSELHEAVFVQPTEEEWLRISKEYNEKWQMPNCIGAIDGRHMTVQVKYNTHYIDSIFIVNQ